MTDETVVENVEQTEKLTDSKKANLPEFFAKKSGMTRIFNEDGKHVTVTVLELVPNIISQVKSSDGKDGYSAYQVAYYEKREKLVNKPIKGHLKKAGVDKNLTRFFEVKAPSVDASLIGKELDLENFTQNTFIDVTGTSKGKGFQGVVKRYGFAGGPATHGSHFHRTTGSIGNRATPGKVFKLKKMPGQMGNKKRTIQNLKVVELNIEEGYMLVNGSIPGHKNSFVKIKKSIKK